MTRKVIDITVRVYDRDTGMESYEVITPTPHMKEVVVDVADKEK